MDKSQLTRLVCSEELVIDYIIGEILRACACAHMLRNTDRSFGRDVDIKYMLEG